ncbi:MAG: hypothetical protein PHY47_00835 [Lachnospiraceae bacterium]|nr:hypothetical protein [Lachnospiraceae bacterium]
MLEFSSNVIAWPWASTENYFLGAAVVYGLIAIIGTICEKKKISLLTPFEIIATCFSKEAGMVIVALSLFWAVILYAGVIIGIPVSICVGLCELGKEQRGNETSTFNRVRSWLGSKTLIDFRDEIK